MDIGGQPFIGSEALSCGALSRHELRRYHRAVMPNVYLDRRITPTLHQRAYAAWLWSGRRSRASVRRRCTARGGSTPTHPLS